MPGQILSAATLALACLLAPTARSQGTACLLDLAFDAPTVAPLALRELPGGRQVIAGEALIVLEDHAHRAVVHERLTSQGIVFIEFDMIRDFVPWTQSTVSIRFVDQAIVNKVKPVSIDDFQLLEDGGLGRVHRRLQVPHSTKLEGRTVRIEFIAGSKWPGPVGAGTGWLVDNVVVSDLGALP
jgi:hypothetical protein